MFNVTFKSANLHQGSRNTWTDFEGPNGFLAWSSGYWLIDFDPEDRLNTAFITSGGIII